ncbi:peroxide stress protein YaaA [Facilibium subflavum]|uniref:peroxide stress protein YaaA n=1 Tax=Facilibium subflavum TaxID=2219058 RepID=UPI000E65DA1E|nr:peroxide stress protein YaaA [Facilibium subflavum]
MLSLISPAKSQDFKVKAPLEHFTYPLFQDDIVKLVTKLKHYEPAEFESLMRISSKLASEVFDKYINFNPKQYTLENAKQALFAFTGDVYKGIEANTLSHDQAEYAQQHLLMISGLYGLLRPLDLMQPYRLEMGTKFSIDDKSLYEFWRDKLTMMLNRQLSTHQNKVVVNLASNEYSKAIDHKKIDGQWIDIDFKEYHKGKYQTIALYAKRARGLMVRFILDGKIDNLDTLKAFDYAGYSLNPDYSSDKKLCFCRVKP